MPLILCWITSVIGLQTISSLKDEIRELRQKIQNQDSKISGQTLENQELQEKLDLQQRYTHTQTGTDTSLLFFMLKNIELYCLI